jgi:adenine/guanine phosphoribosyltransferase-like PRPP-binding protein
MRRSFFLHPARVGAYSVAQVSGPGDVVLIVDDFLPRRGDEGLVCIVRQSGARWRGARHRD